MNRGFWWIYAFVICAIGYGRMFERIIKDSGGFWSQFGPPIAAMVLAIGMLGWLHNRTLLNVWAWRGVHAFLVLGQLFAALLATYLAVFGVYAPATLILAFAAILIPASIALFRYSYRSAALWKLRE